MWSVLCFLPESIAVIKEEIFGLHVSQVQHGAFTPEDYSVPEHHLVQRLTHKKKKGIKRCIFLVKLVSFYMMWILGQLLQ